MYYLISILFGLIPEVLYFTLFITYTKNIKEKRIKLFLLIVIAYFICITILQYQVLCDIMFIITMYLILKLLYKNKTQIIDIFIITISYFWLLLLSFLLMNFANKDLSNYMFLYFIQRILMFSIFIFKNKFNNIYKKYCKLWNRNDNEKRIIKSITLRNLSLILLNVFIFASDIILKNIIQF